MKRLLLMTLSLVASSASAAGPLPSSEEVASLIAKKVCYTMAIEVTRLADGHGFPKLTFPLCVDMPAMYVEYACFHQGETYYNCPISAVSPDNHYLRVTTPGYEFSSYATGVARTMAQGWTEPDGLVHEHLALDEDYQLEDVWSLRLTQIINVHKSELPVAFASLILPDASGPETYVGGSAGIRFAGEERQFNPNTHGKRPFQSLQALGYDATGAEYGMHISTEFAHVDW